MIMLRTSPGSPYGRKARIAILHLGLGERVRVEPSTTRDPADPIHAINPLRKMPALVTEDGVAIYDSPVILEYLDWLAGGGRIIPIEPAARFRALTLQALADGLTDAAVLIRYEDRWRSPQQRSEPWLTHQQQKIDGALAALERAPPPRDGLDVGQIAAACALPFYEKSASRDWRADHPGLAAWLDDFARRIPAFGDSRP
jgi:glutathione S-transferase